MDGIFDSFDDSYLVMGELCDDFNEDSFIGREFVVRLIEEDMRVDLSVVEVMIEVGEELCEIVEFLDYVLIVEVEFSVEVGNVKNVLEFIDVGVR